MPQLPAGIPEEFSTSTTIKSSTVQQVIPSIEEVKQFIEENASFFKTPLPNFTSTDNPAYTQAIISDGQKIFIAFYEHIGEMDTIRDYSNKLKHLLYIHQEQIGQDLQRPVLGAWFRGNFDVALQHAPIRQFIMANKCHPAIRIWNSRDDLNPLLTTSGFFKALNNLQEKAQGFNEQKHPKAKAAATLLFNELNAAKNQFLSGIIDRSTFVKQCQNLVVHAKKSELKNHRNVFGMIFDAILKVLDYLTAGYITPIHTDSIDKINALSDSLDKLVGEKPNEEVDRYYRP
ncbi:MAG: hypothetical protein PSV35_04215 [bacterium]|nr:hypothetical protein [bacterium]